MAVQGIAIVVVGIGLASLLYYIFSGSGPEPLQQQLPRQQQQQQYNYKGVENRPRKRGPFRTDECPICLDAITMRTSFTPQCGHTFHMECINRWNVDAPKDVRNTCPLCRKTYT